MTVRTAAAPRPRLTARAAVLAAVVLALLVALTVPLRQYVEQRSRIAELRQQVDLLQQREALLVEEIERLEDPEHLERLARKCLGMVRPGEISFVTVPKGGKAKPPRC